MGRYYAQRTEHFYILFEKSQCAQASSQATVSPDRRLEEKCQIVTLGTDSVTAQVVDNTSYEITYCI